MPVVCFSLFSVKALFGSGRRRLGGGGLVEWWWVRATRRWRIQMIVMLHGDSDVYCRGYNGGGSE